MLNALITEIHALRLVKKIDH